MDDEQIAVMYDLAKKQQLAVSQVLRELEIATKGINKAVEGSVRESMQRNLGNIEENAQNALKRPVGAFESEINNLTQKAKEINSSLNQVSDKLTMKLYTLVGVVTFACLVAVYGSYFWLGAEIESMRAEQLQMQSNLKVLEEAGGKVHLNRCGGQLCVRIDPNGDKGYTDPSTNLPLYMVK